MPLVITSTAATFDLNGFTETIGSLAFGVAGKVTLVAGLLTAGGNNLSTTNAAVISGTGSFTKAGNQHHDFKREQYLHRRHHCRRRDAAISVGGTHREHFGPGSQQ